MYNVFIQTAILILLGVLWRRFSPQGLDADTLRRSLTTLVYVLLLPALVVVVLWRADLSLDSVRVAVLAALGVLSGMVMAWLWYRGGKSSAPAIGAMILASGFPNATYMGLPVLESALGPWARSVAVQYDLFACTPLLLSVGIMIAAHYGSVKVKGHPVLALLQVPPLWAAVAGITLNLAAVPLPKVAGGLLDMLASGVVPLMLFSLGLGLRWAAGGWSHLPQLLPVVAIQLFITPLLVWGASTLLGMSGPVQTAVVLEAGMPSMVLGIVLCDRYKLDTSLYAMAVTLTTAISLFTLPLWLQWVG
jgi:predicted permease